MPFLVVDAMLSSQAFRNKIDPRRVEFSTESANFAQIEKLSLRNDYALTSRIMLVLLFRSSIFYDVRPSLAKMTTQGLGWVHR